MNNDQPTESTPLLVSLPDSRANHILPSIAEGLDVVQAGGVVQSLSTFAAQTAYQLLILLQWHLTTIENASNVKDIWERRDQKSRRSSDLKVLEDRINSVWDDFVKEYRSSKEIQDALWLQFPVDRNSHRFVRVVDFIACSHDILLADGLIDLSLQRTWKYGFEADRPLDSSFTNQLLKRYDALSTPRVLHFLELVGELLILVTLLHFLLYPPAEPIITGWNLKQQGLREYFLMLFPIALLTRPWSIRDISFILVLLSFVFALPSVPLPSDSSFIVLHIALAVQILFLHFPHPPSPLFLFPCHQSLPLSVLLTHSMSYMLVPIMLFFLPVLLLAALLLSLSLADTAFKLSLTNTLDPSPMQTRAVFLTLFAAAALLLLLCLIMGAAKFPSLSVADKSVTPHGQSWDRYSRRVGLDARRAFARALMRYSNSYYFPPPLNLLHLLFVRLPCAVLSVFGKKGPSLHLEVVEQILWRATVGPFVGFFAGLWLWSLGK